jgi:hypothetical protein
MEQYSGGGRGDDEDDSKNSYDEYDIADGAFSNRGVVVHCKAGWEIDRNVQTYFSYIHFILLLKLLRQV